MISTTFLNPLRKCVDLPKRPGRIQKRSEMYRADVYIGITTYRRAKYLSYDSDSDAEGHFCRFLKSLP